MNYDKIIQTVETTHDAEMDAKREVPKYASFPFDECYEGQNEAIERIMEEEMSLLCSHTGSGKSAVFLTAAHELGLPTLVIEPRKFLQKQVGEYFGDFCIYGKGEYPCDFAPSAASAPCAIIFKHKGEKWFVDGEGKDRPYPCYGCKYIFARIDARIVLKDKGVLICNFGNFWQYLKAAKFVVIDEADEFFRAISSSIKLEWVGINDLDIDINLCAEMDNVAGDIEELNSKQSITQEEAKKLNKLKSKTEKISFFRQNADLCFMYAKKKDMYVEIQPQRTPILLNRLFKGKKVCIVTATPSAFMDVEKWK